MNLKGIKEEVYTLTCTKTTTQLKKERPDLTQGRDLRYKRQWVEILEQIKQLRAQGEDLSLADLEESEQMLKDSLYKVGRLSGLDDQEIEMEWHRIKLEAQWGDIHIEEL